MNEQGNPIQSKQKTSSKAFARKRSRVERHTTKNQLRTKTGVIGESAETLE